MGKRREIEIRLTPENAHATLIKGDIIVEAEELGQVVSARPTVDRPGQERWILVYFMGGDCYKEQFGPQTLRVLRETGLPEYEATGRPIGTHVMVEISKVGGGTPGRRYQGTWSYRITDKGRVVAEGDDLTISTPKTHEEAARIAWGFQDAAYAAEHLDD